MKPILSCIFFFWSFVSFSQSLEKNLPPEHPQFHHLATARPDRIMLSWSGDPSTTQTVTWRTDTIVKKAYAEIALLVASPNFHEQSRKVTATTIALRNQFSHASYHQVTFEGLQPQTNYLYRVGEGEYWSEWIPFATSSPAFKPFTFIYLGDAQNKLYSHWSRVIRSAYKEAPKAKFILHAGDLINHSQNDYEWAEWFEAGSFIHRTIPVIATPGNHEYIKNENGKKIGISPFWDVQFNFQKNGPQHLSDQCYYQDIQGVRVISLNSNQDIELQADWLEKVLSENSNLWTVVTFHHPVVSAAKGRVNTAVLEKWKPVLDQYSVDLVLQGHDHTYGRGQNLVTGSNEYEENSGTVYVVSVSGSKMYKLTDQPWMQRSTENRQLYQTIDVFEDHLIYRSRTADGKVYDAFKLIKKGRKPNQLELLDHEISSEFKFDYKND